jgi:hypothetical protein
MTDRNKEVTEKSGKTRGRLPDGISNVSGSGLDYTNLMPLQAIGGQWFVI